MSNNTNFREDTVNVDGKNVTVKFQKIKDIFSFGDTPYVAVGQSGTGKSVIANDIFYIFGKDATKIYYLSATEATIGDNPIPCLPEFFKRQISFKTLNSIFNFKINIF